MNKYKEYKDSKIDSLDDIPSHWQVKKLQYLGSIQNGISESAEYFGSGYPFVSYGDVYNNMVLPCIVSGLAQSSNDDRKRMSVEVGDVLFTRTSETIEEIGISSTCLKSIENAIFSGFLIRFRPTTQLLTKEFSKYYFRSFITRKFFVKEMNIVTRASLSQDLLKRLPIILPSLGEQKIIAQYLDLETDRIDNLIAKKQKQIDLLQEKRTAIIQKAITKGINPAVKLKSSGIEWLGEVPEHWEVMKLKRMLDKMESGRRENDENNDFAGQVLSIGGEHIGWFGEWILDNPRYISDDYFNNLNQGKIKLNDVLLVKDGATIGKTLIANPLPGQRMALNEHVYLLRANKQTVPKYLYYLISSKLGQEQVKLQIRGAAQPGLNSEFGNTTYFVLPEIAEQREICSFLDVETSRIDEMKTKIQTSINKLQEYRSAVITAAVIGKIDVREEVKK